jgi:hypothetical protein
MANKEGKTISEVSEQVWQIECSSISLELEECIRSLSLRDKIEKLLSFRSRKLFCEYFLEPSTNFVLECFNEPMSTEKIRNFNKFLIENISVSSSTFVLSLILLAKLRWRKSSEFSLENRDQQFLVYISCVMTAACLIEDLHIKVKDWLSIINSYSGFRTFSEEEINYSQISLLKNIHYATYVSSNDFHKFLDIILGESSELDFSKIFEIFEKPSRPDFEL